MYLLLNCFATFTICCPTYSCHVFCYQTIIQHYLVISLCPIIIIVGYCCILCYGLLYDHGVPGTRLYVGSLLPLVVLLGQAAHKEQSSLELAAPFPNPDEEYRP